MGQQQLLLLILAMIIVGIAVAGGIVLFRGGAVAAARDAVALDIEDLAIKAQAYYRKPTSMLGGGYSFRVPGGSSVIDITYLMRTGRNENGRYLIEPSSSNPQRLLIVGKAYEVVGTDTVEVHGIVTADSLRVMTIY